MYKYTTDNSLQIILNIYVLNELNYSRKQAVYKQLKKIHIMCAYLKLIFYTKCHFDLKIITLDQLLAIGNVQVQKSLLF